VNGERTYEKVFLMGQEIIAGSETMETHKETPALDFFLLIH
jgi:hypothetical protein